MRYKKILLVNPPYTGARVRDVFCAGLGYIAENLKMSGFEYDVLDMSLGYRYKHLKKKIDFFKPDLIGISMMTYQYKESYRLTGKIKEDYPEIAIVTGGPHISLFREKVLYECHHIDYGVVLEGEDILIDLCRGNKPDSVKGLIFRDQNRIIYNRDRPFIKNLDTVPFPKYEKFELEKSINKEINAMPIVSSRGCPFECIYCPVKYSIGNVFRARSPENILNELIYWYDKGYRRFSFADDNFTLIKERVYKLCDLIKEYNLKDLRLSCDNGIRADRVDKDLLGFMKDVGFYRIALGVEAGNNKILKILKKSEDIETIKKVIKDACVLGYEVDLFFLVGSPGETWEDVQDSFRIALNNPIGTAYFYNIIPFPKTELYDWIEKNGRFLMKSEDYLNDYPILDNEPIFETQEMPLKMRKKALKYAFKIMRKTMRKAWGRRMVELGILGKLVVFIYVSKFMQDVILRNKYFRKIIYKMTDFYFFRN